MTSAAAHGRVGALLPARRLLRSNACARFASRCAAQRLGGGGASAPSFVIDVVLLVLPLILALFLGLHGVFLLGRAGGEHRQVVER
jgi:hypothetical protein